MEGYDEFTYGERIAEVYDRFYGDVESGLVDVLEELAGGGRALELGVGTGRIAIPLHERGVHVAGIEASPDMISMLREKPGGEAIEVHHGSFGDFDLDSDFSLVFVVFNTLFALLTQEEQVQCFQSVAEHLSVRGKFLVEAFVPDLCRYEREEQVSAVEVDQDGVRLAVSRLDPAAQQVRTQHVQLNEDGVKMFPVKLRYVWPAEMDLMAQMAGLELEHRWGGWHKEDFRAESDKHVSVYARPA